MHLETQEKSGVVLYFPIGRLRYPLSDIIVPAKVTYYSCIVLPLRKGREARKAQLLLNLRRLHEEIKALTAGKPI